MRVINSAVVSAFFVVLSWSSSFAVELLPSSPRPLLEQAQRLFDPLPLQPPQYADGRLSAERIALGKMLFFDPRLSSSHIVSCHSCHNLSLGGVDGLTTSLGHRWQSGPRNSPTVWNAVFQIAQFWDGRARDLVEQAAAPMTSPLEMASSDPQVCSVLSSIPEYVQLFGEAFPERDDPICFATIRLALAAFETTLITPNAPFDLYLRGDRQAISALQKQGLNQFIKLGCADCHMSMNIGGNGYYTFGVKQPPAEKYRPVTDHGRREVIDTVTGDYVFKSASLRNVQLTAPYFHSGAASSLTEAIEVMAQSQLGQTLDDGQLEKLSAFMLSLTGELPEITLPQLPASTERTPHPQY